MDCHGPPRQFFHFLRPGLAFSRAAFLPPLPLLTPAPYIVAKALCYAIAFIDTLPFEQQEHSDRDDMVAILIETVPEVRREFLAREVEGHTGILPDFTNWKLGD